MQTETPKATEPTIADWIAEHGHEIAEAQEFTLDDIPDEPAISAQHLSMGQSLYARTGFLLAEMETFVAREHVAAMMRARAIPDLSAKEREVFSKGDPTYLKVRELQGKLQVIVTALGNKNYAIMNLRRTTLDPHSQAGSDA